MASRAFSHPRRSRVFGLHFESGIIRVTTGFLNAVMRPRPGRELVRIDLLDREIDPKYLLDRGARLDVLARTANGTLINIEVQVANQYDVALPVRMLRYRSDIWEATLYEGKGTPAIRQVVVFFYRENDNKVHRLHDRWGEAAMLDYTYRVIRIWEEPGQPVIEKELIGLYPLLPLMKGDREKEEPKQVLSESIATIQKVEDVSLRQDLLAAMAIMAGGRYAPELIRTMIRRE
jgi:predicted transposase/invertase (TIGR01784 family)